MFSGKTEVKRLHSKEVTEKCVRELNRLAKQQHSGAHPMTVDGLLHKMGRGLVLVVATADDKIIGFGFVALQQYPAHSVLSLHSLIVLMNHDSLAIGKRIYEALLEETKGWVYDHIDAECWENDAYALSILSALGFKQREGRLKFRFKPKR